MIVGVHALVLQSYAFWQFDFEAQYIHQIYAFDNNAFGDGRHCEYTVAIGIYVSLDGIAASFYQLLQHVSGDIACVDVGCDTDEFVVCLFNGDLAVEVSHEYCSAFVVDSFHQSFGALSEYCIDRSEEYENDSVDKRFHDGVPSGRLYCDC